MAVARRAQLKQLQDHAALLLDNGLDPDPRRRAPRGANPSCPMREWFIRLKTGIKISASSRTYA